MKKLFMFLILGMFLISFAAASVDYVEENQTYTIDTWLPNWLGGDGESTVTLINNTDQCLTDCSFTLEFKNEQEVSLLEDLAFLDRKGNDVQSTLKNVEFKIGTYENQTKIIPIYNTTCEDVYNSTTNNVTQSCTTINTANETETEEVLVWNDYNGEKVDGLNYLKINAKKYPTKSMDWIVTFRGNDLVNWAWWNSSWDYKRVLNVTETSGSSFTNYSTLIYVNYTEDTNSHAKSDFSDLRFLDSTESVELGYFIQNKTDSSFAWVWVNVPSLTASSTSTIYMYYGNTGASSGSNGFNTFAYYNDGTVDDFTDNIVGTATASLDSGTIKSVATGWSSSAYVFPSAYTSGRFQLKYDIKSGTQLGGFSFSDQTVANAYDSGTPLTLRGSDYSPVNYETWTYGSLGSQTTNTWSNVSSILDLGVLSASNGFYVNVTNSSGTTFTRTDGVRGTMNDLGMLRFMQYTTTTYIDNVIFRELASSEPTYLFGAEEQNAGSISVVFVTPPTPVNYANTTNETITVQVSPTYVNASLTNISYDFYNVNGTVITEFFTNETYQINVSLPTAHYHYNVTICGEETITPSDICASTETRHLNHDVTPPVINLTAPSGTFNYLINGTSLDLNWTVYDEGEGLGSCWYDYNGTNNTVTCNDNHTTFNYLADVNTLTFWANDTFGNYQSEATTWTYKLLEVNQTYNAAVTEGSIETFLAHTKLGSGLSISDAVLFNYNGTETTGQAFVLGDYNILRKANFLVPSVSTDTNYTFYWEVTLSDATKVNLSSQNQTIYNLAIDNCSSYTNEILNFTVVDEETQVSLPNATIETALNFYDASRTEVILNYSMLFEKVNPLRICLSRNITNDTAYSMDVIVRYEDSSSANEYYNIVNQTVDADTNSTRITLYDLNLTDSTEFQLTFTGSDFLPVEGALVYIDRQYISENQFKTVELPKTDYNGQTVLHLVRNDVIYNIRVIKDGVVLGNFESLTAFCDDYTIGDCNIELNAFDSVEAIFNYDSSLGIIFTAPTYNATSDKVSFNFVTDDGSTKTVQLVVTRNDIFGNRSVCNSSMTSSGGTLTCDIDPNLDDSVLKTEIYVDNVLAVSSNVKLDSTGYGVGGYLIFVVMIISFALMFSGSKTGVLVSIVLSFAGAIGLSLVSGDLIGLGASGLWLLVIVIIGIIKLNKERTQ